jgi:hypothetical protein
MSDDNKAPGGKGKPEMFDVRELVANDPDLPQGILPARKRSAAKRQRKAQKPTRSESGKSSVYLFVVLGLLGALIAVPAAIFIFIRYVLPPFR